MKDKPLSDMPSFPLKLLKAFCNPLYHIDIEGDLMELYERRCETVGVKKAKWLLYKDVVLLFRPGIIRPFKLFSNFNSLTMFRHHFKISFRTLWRDKGFSLINIGGLALGMTVTLLIGLWLWNELSYNKNFENYDHIALIKQRGTSPDGTQFVSEYQVTALQKPKKFLPSTEMITAIL
jgi:hypothetical protein